MNFLCFAFGLLVLNSFSVTKPSDQDVGLTGTWRGTSLCVDRTGSCHDEQVIYRIKQTAGSAQVNIDADRITDGKVVNMGALVFTYDKEKNMLIRDSGKSLWQFTVKGNQIEGVLLIDGKTFRKVGLKKD